MNWLAYGAVFVAFLASHSIPLRPRVRQWMVGRMGRGGFALGYSALSLVMLALLIRAAGLAPFVPLWPQEPWHRTAAQAGMAAVCAILAFGVARPNPFSFGGAGNERFDPARPGLLRWTRHPVLAALALWAGVHLLANGALAHVLLFAVLGVFALAGMPLVDRRKRREMGAARWQDLRRAVAATPALPRPRPARGVLLRTGCALGLYATLVALHPALIGVPAW
ncbi:NnrU family protein [Aestuariicoccus sp. MJ-SS9]|uniref:NnrU family protein n=1 Tax=Aestuariicoccus sp. MJ-SS9 TaxID=3079855 RepID=UPI00291165B6|nr:NnrU family protein [Aestuariicoccus sp. MJ-SS9]MDU8910305.1 NnrU family protein [Aestuariicoccus sp. MJ-SS9]